MMSRDGKFKQLLEKFKNGQLVEIRLYAPPLFGDRMDPTVAIPLCHADFDSVFDGSIPPEPEPDQDPFWWAIQVLDKMMPGDQRR